MYNCYYNHLKNTTNVNVVMARKMNGFKDSAFLFRQFVIQVDRVNPWNRIL